ncbi:MAG: exodeoxyribonuclease large subunit, partial [Anaerophaga sp.]|nr:exodeoxyribonuclease large subunit [Anaerophaga sp.]
HIAQFPLPVITGIGHERDESVADLVANTMLKTPTAVAAFLIERAATFLQMIDEKAFMVADMVRDIIEKEKQRTANFANAYVPLVKMDLQKRKSRLDRMMGRLPVSVSHRMGKEKYVIQRFGERTKNATSSIFNGNRQLLIQYKTNLRVFPSRFLHASRQKLDFLEQSVHFNDPQHLLKRGYSLTYVDGKLVKDISMINKGEQTTTRFIDGEVTGTVESIKKYKNRN